MKKRLFYYFLFSILIMTLTGCWNSRELKELSVMQALGIDLNQDGKFKLTSQIMRPSQIKGPSGSKNGGGQGVWIVTSTGETLFDALRNATMQSDRKLFLAQNKVIVISEEAAAMGIAPLLELWDRDPEGRLMVNLFIARGMAEDIIKGEHMQENIPGKAIISLSKAAAATSKIARVYLLDVLKALQSKTSDPYIPGIEVFKSEAENGKELLRLSKTAVFKKDKLVGWYDERETRGLLWVLGKVKSGIIIIQSPGEEDKKLSLEIIRASSKVTPEINEGQLIINLMVKVESNLGEQLSQTNLIKPELFKEMEKREAEAIIAEINAALGEAQTLGIDPFQFGEAFHRKYPKEWVELRENWDEEFRKLILNIEVEARLRRSGFTSTPVMGESAEN